MLKNVQTKTFILLKAGFIRNFYGYKVKILKCWFFYLYNHYEFRINYIIYIVVKLILLLTFQMILKKVIKNSKYYLKREMYLMLWVY